MKINLKICICIILVFILTIMCGCGTQYIGGTRDEKWVKDLNYLQKALPQKHIDLFFKISEEEFNNEINELKDNVKNLNDDEIIAGIYKIAASVGEGHTKAYKSFDEKYPLIFYYFKDDIYLINTTHEYKEALYCKLTKVNDMDIKDVEENLVQLSSAENKAIIKKNIPNYLNNPQIIHGRGINDNIENCKFTFEDKSGNTFDLKVKSIDQSNAEFIIKEYDESYPLYMQNQNLSYWYKYLEDWQTIYFKYNACTSDKESGNIDDIINEIFNLIDNNGAKKLVIDMRDNGGGSDRYLQPLIEGLKERNINNSSSLFVIVGRVTFSSAIINACQLKNDTNAMLVGEETSGKPNHCGVVKNFKLPNSKIIINYSTSKCNIWDTDDNTLVPDKIIEISREDYINKKDPVLDYILNM